VPASRSVDIHLGRCRSASDTERYIKALRQVGLVSAQETLWGQVEETEQQSSGPHGLLPTLAQVETDTTGIDTFQRYLWQAKQAVRLWLTCLRDADNPLFLVCEQVEDIALVYADKIRFLQLKTRDRGSWSAYAMCNRGIDALVRSYIAARKTGICEIAEFELWLEGPIADTEKTVTFCSRPSDADTSIRKKIVSLGIRGTWLDDFLQRLTIHPDQPSRAHIDAKAIYELGAIWRNLSQSEIHVIYDRLLTAATNAQAASVMPMSIQAHLAAARPNLASVLPEGSEPGAVEIDAIRNQILSLGMCVALTPPLPGESIEKLLGRVSEGSAASLLELKMISAGAGTETIRRTMELRADMEVKRQLLLASRETAEAELERLATSVLTVADATATKMDMFAASNPATAVRPGEAIAADLLSRPGDLAQCDRQALFDRDGHLLYGYIGHLSDLCRFKWRVK
jgi:hypothetical protein